MKLANCVVLLSLFGMSALAQETAPLPTNLKVGDMAPDFTLPSTQGGAVTLSSFRGKQTVVLAFFPAAFTGGCTKKMQTDQIGLDMFKGNDAPVSAVG